MRPGGGRWWSFFVTGMIRARAVRRVWWGTAPAGPSSGRWWTAACRAVPREPCRSGTQTSPCPTVRCSNWCSCPAVACDASLKENRQWQGFQKVSRNLICLYGFRCASYVRDTRGADSLPWKFVRTIRTQRWTVCTGYLRWRVKLRGHVSHRTQTKVPVSLMIFNSWTVTDTEDNISKGTPYAFLEISVRNLDNYIIYLLKKCGWKKNK